MVRRSKNGGAPLRLNKRARKLAEVLAARSDLPPAEVERLARAEETFERKQKQVQERLGKGFNKMVRQLNPKKGQRGSSKSARFPRK